MRITSSTKRRRFLRERGAATNHKLSAMPRLFPEFMVIIPNLTPDAPAASPSGCFGPDHYVCPVRTKSIDEDLL